MAEKGGGFVPLLLRSSALENSCTFTLGMVRSRYTRRASAEEFLHRDYGRFSEEKGQAIKLPARLEHTEPEHSRLEVRGMCLAPESQALPPRSKKAYAVSDESGVYYLGNLPSRGVICASHTVFCRRVLGFFLIAEHCDWFIPLPAFLIKEIPSFSREC